jgi:hypothetical protein
MAKTIDLVVNSNGVTVLNQTTVAAEGTAEAIKSLNTQFNDLKKQQQQYKPNTKEFKELTLQMAELKKQMKESADAVNQNAQPAIEGLRGTFGTMKEQVLDFNFEGLTESLKSFTANLSRVNVASITGSLKAMLSAGVQGFKTLGNVIKANPIFLVAGLLIGLISYWKEITDLVSGKSKMIAGLKQQAEILKSQEQTLTRELALQKALGAGAAQILKTELELLKNKQKQAETAMKLAYAENNREEFLTAQQAQLQAINDLEIRKVKINEDAQALLDKIRSTTDDQYNKQLLQNEAFSQYKARTEELGVLQQDNAEKIKQLNYDILMAQTSGNNELAKKLQLEQQSLTNQNISFQNNKDEIWNAGEAAKDNVKTEKELEAIAKAKAAAAEKKAKADAESKRIADEALAVDKRLDEVEKERADAKKTALNKELDDTLALQEKEYEAYLAAKKNETELQNLKIRHSQELQGIFEKFAQLNQEKADEDAKKLKELQQEGINQKQAELIELQSIIDAADEANYQSKLSNQQQELMASQEYYFQLKTQAEAAGLDTAALTEEQARKENEIKKKYRDEDEANRMATQETRLRQVGESLAALGALNDAFTKKGQQQSKKQFQIQKALNLASAVIDTYGGINRALNDKTMPSTTARIIQASIVGAMGLANVLKISKTEYGNASNPSGANMSTGGGGNGGGTEAPSPANFAFLGNQPNQQPPLQAYVVSTQVSSNLEAQQLIQNQSRLGG